MTNVIHDVYLIDEIFSYLDENDKMKLRILNHEYFIRWNYLFLEKVRTQSNIFIEHLISSIKSNNYRILENSLSYMLDNTNIDRFAAFFFKKYTYKNHKFMDLFSFTNFIILDHQSFLCREVLNSLKVQSRVEPYLLKASDKRNRTNKIDKGKKSKKNKNENNYKGKIFKKSKWTTF